MGADGAWSPAKSLGDEFKGSLSTFSPTEISILYEEQDIYWVDAESSMS